ncbi:hypothetical protein IFM89_027948 [Coptis chinensis]|uniref:Protein CHUP1, chloroplastic n=1 Tax=Coptis chinensis TaxID=261450 RepID=A0A835IFH6_9MAGN|nr:hypothetical protein IFM89_027948 [Coptis chinensis]
MMLLVKMMKENKGIKPLLLKFGVVLAISFVGFLYSHLRAKRISSNSSSSSGEKKISSGSTSTTPTSCDAASITQESMKETSHLKATMDAPPLGFALCKKHLGVEESFLLPEFNDLVLDEFEVHSNNKTSSPRKDADKSMTLKIAVDKETEKEIHHLRNMVHMLQERERSLEMQLLEYYGLKEQETAVMELRNRIKINSMEAKLFTLKIESLQADKKRLEAQVADHSKVLAELESVRTKLKMLKKKIRLDEEQTKEQLSMLQHKVSDLKDQEYGTVGRDVDIGKGLQRLKELEEESSGLRMANSRLQGENSELLRRLESTQVLATSVLELPECEALQEANQWLKKENEDLTKEVEQLQANRCSDVEELVYLRWVNACLRYELRNYQPPRGKTVARDLSKTLSPKSEEKAKQLILEYANSEGNGDKGLLDFDSEFWSSSQDSSNTESFDLDDSPIDVSHATRTHSSSKSRFFSKLRKLVHGKESPKHHHSSGRRSMSTNSFEEMGTYSGSTVSSHHNSSMSSIDSTVCEVRFDEHSNKCARRCQSLSRTSFDHRPRAFTLESIKEVEGKRRNSDLGSSSFYKRMSLKEGGRHSGLGKDNTVEQDLASEKLELMKFAEVLKGSSKSPRAHRSQNIVSHDF